MPRRSGRSERTTEERIIRILDQELQIKNDEMKWELNSMSDEESIHRIRTFLELMKPIISQPDREKFESNYIECIKKLSSKQGVYAYLLFCN